MNEQTRYENKRLEELRNSEVTTRELVAGVLADLEDLAVQIEKIKKHLGVL